MKQTIVMASLALQISCASKTAPPNVTTPAREVPASDQTIVADMDPTFDGQSIYVTNSSTVPVTVTSIRLTDCVNVSNPCTLTPVKVRVGPGSRVRVFVVRPADPGRAYSYRYYWTWGAAQ
jgi:hypothetical protein